MIVSGNILTVDGNIPIQDLKVGDRLREIRARIGGGLVTGISAEKYTGDILDFGDFSVTADTILHTMRGIGTYDKVSKDNKIIFKDFNDKMVTKKFVTKSVKNIDAYNLNSDTGVSFYLNKILFDINK